MAVAKVGNDTFEVRNFLQSMCHLVYVVHFKGNEASVISRTGCTSTEWDQHAIAAVQSYILLGG